ncbi:hypothetical protein F8388_018659 [Cannabis sativa]|uniref:Uncharacterized protein n=1 Tax=Cannabis sativa TaxID=3483 RepID=A0A7J6FD10_CANSA|nr:hypothetical protein F8388_018659 [Cannabis sativa]
MELLNVKDFPDHKECFGILIKDNKWRNESERDYMRDVKANGPPFAEMMVSNHSDYLKNTRAIYAIEYIPNMKKSCFGPHPKNVIPLACDIFSKGCHVENQFLN